MALNIADLVEHAVDLVPERVAVVCGERHVTYAQLESRANRLAHHLAAHGVVPGSHVGVYSRNSVEMLETMLAAYKLRAVAININYRYLHAELRYVCDNSDLVALVHQRRYAPLVAEVLPEVDSIRHVVVVEDGSAEPVTYPATEYEAALAESAPERDFPERSPDDVYILYTGGTTGHPKGVLWRQEDVWRVLGGGIDFVTGVPVADEWQQARQGKDFGLVRLCAAPMIHGAAQWAALGALFTGSTVVLVAQFDAAQVWQAVQRHRVNVLAIVGDAMARPLIESYRDGQWDASSVVAISSSAALFSQAVKDQYLATFPNVVITDAIGSSETGFTGIGVVAQGQEHRGGPRVKADPDSIVLGEDGTPVGPGVVGRLARGGHVPLGYYKDPAKTAELFTEVDGKRYAVPGDFARLEQDGTVTLLGRGNMCVNTAGEKVFPEEVEGVLKSHPHVFDALVLGVPDERLGQRVAAVVQPRPGRTVSLSDLDAHVRGRIAGYKVPRSLWLVDSVSRLPSGKPDYRWARRHVEEHEPAVRYEVTAGEAHAHRAV
ncbi:acyl-CoA synthetase [Kutzneria albida]|uniref:Long-chain-fatty-acid--CoA ligase FadD19 n=1 Tax=Kutzneria albida DSM 43870 TaxID=1449976 RepID=W5W795_9PSEU|nr:acyl-CoA synthetase [Kutzneria albida]AHH96772.1 Long-chain-fatty-acid--CoA ligase FadD19 [Kutzneria albida DSM 43870]